MSVTPRAQSFAAVPLMLPLMPSNVMFAWALAVAGDVATAGTTTSWLIAARLMSLMNGIVAGERTKGPGWSLLPQACCGPQLESIFKQASC